MLPQRCRWKIQIGIEQDEFLTKKNHRGKKLKRQKMKRHSTLMDQKKIMQYE